MFHERILPLGPLWDRSPRAPSEQGFRAFFPPLNKSRGKLRFALAGTATMPPAPNLGKSLSPLLGHKQDKNTVSDERSKVLAERPQVATKPRGAATP